MEKFLNILSKLDFYFAWPYGGIVEMVLQTLPWVEQDRQGLFQSFFQTVKWFFGAPSQAYESLRPSSPLGPPLAYAALGGSIGSIASLMWNFANRVFTNEMDNPELGLLGLALMAIAAPALAVVGVTLNAALCHLTLILLGASNSGFGATFQASAYASGTAAMLQVIPVLGALGAFVLSLVYSGIGVYKLHQISRGQAVAVVLLPLLIIAGIGLALALALIGMGSMISSLPSLPLF